MINIPLATLLFTGGNFLLVGQNVHYNRLTYNELRRNHCQDEKYHAAVLAALRGQNCNERDDTMHKELIRLIDKEVEDLIRRECNGLTTVGQNQLHLLLENRMHLERCAEHIEESNGTEKSYFGG